MHNDKFQQELELRVGYACIHLGMKKKYKAYKLKTIEERNIEKIKEVIHNNIFLLGDIIHDNIKNNIYVYRITADLIPFASNAIVKDIIEEHGILEEVKIKKEFERIRKWQETYNLRISMHASPFVILSSPKKDVVEKSIEELVALQDILKLVNGQNLVLHLGGAYGDKSSALQRFTDVIKDNNKLDLSILTIENDDKTYSSEDVVEVCKQLGIKWVYDYHHERCKPSMGCDIIKLIKSYPPDKYHLSSGVDAIIKPPHADFITYEDMYDFIKQLQEADIKEADVILEAKQKNLAITPILDPLQNGYWQLKENSIS